MSHQIPLEVEKCQDKTECFNADLKADWERWQSNKRHDFKQLLTGLADKNISHYEKVENRLSQWASSPVDVGVETGGFTVAETSMERFLF